MIELSNISVNYGIGTNQISALKHISAHIEKGEFVSIMGKSGCGKTTLLNVIGGIIKPTSGQYMFDCKNVLAFRNKQLASFRNKNVSFIVQNFALVNELTVYQNVMLPLIYARLKKNDSKHRVDEALKAVDIVQYGDKFPPQLSGGERQRVAIARSIAANTQVILADEPTGALDEQNGRMVMELFRALNHSGKTIVMVTHDGELAKYGSRILTMKDGEFIHISER